MGRNDNRNNGRGHHGNQGRRDNGTPGHLHTHALGDQLRAAGITRAGPPCLVCGEPIDVRSARTIADRQADGRPFDDRRENTAQGYVHESRTVYERDPAAERAWQAQCAAIRASTPKGTKPRLPPAPPLHARAIPGCLPHAEAGHRAKRAAGVNAWDDGSGEKAERGFTLVEVMIALAGAAFVAFFVFAVWATYQDHKTCKRSHYEPYQTTECSTHTIGDSHYTSCVPVTRHRFVCDERYTEVPE